ncbi:MAG: glycoside hydrolase family 97 protein [Planctomycetota bacterium]
MGPRSLPGLGILLALGAFAAAGEPAVVLRSPDGRVEAAFHPNAQRRLTYELARNGEPVIERSAVGITVDGLDLGEKAVKLDEERYEVDETYPWRGVHSTAVNRCNGLKLSLRTGAVEWTLEARCYDDGLAFRYVVPGEGMREVNGEATTFVLPGGHRIKHLGSGAGEETRVGSALSDALPEAGMAPPLVFYSEEKRRFNALMEGGGFEYHGVGLRGDGGTLSVGFFGRPSWKVDGPIDSSWRIICTCDDMNGLVNSDIVHNVCPPPDKALFPDGPNTEWIKPGKSVWNWWAKLNIKKIPGVKTLIGQAKALGCQYVLIDYGWESSWPNRIRQVCGMAEEQGIGIFAWKPSPVGVGNLRKELSRMKDPPRLPDGEIDISRIPSKHDRYRRYVVPEDREKRRAMLEKLAAAGVKGIKLDYIDSESARWKNYMVDVLRDCAEFKLMVVFHGCCIPAGESRTYPNEVSREAIYGLEKIRGGGGAAKMPSSLYVNLAFTRFLAGHADFTPVTLGQRSQGYTHAMQIASALVFTSPFLVLAEDPRLIEASPALPIVRSMPAEWDETIVLPGSRFDTLAAFARRKGAEWYVAMINGYAEREQSYSLPLGFLGDGKYEAFLCRDTPGNNSIRTETVTVEPADRIEVKMNPTGGFIARFRRKR